SAYSAHEVLLENTRPIIDAQPRDGTSTERAQSLQIAIHALTFALMLLISTMCVNLRSPFESGIAALVRSATPAPAALSGAASPRPSDSPGAPEPPGSPDSIPPRWPGLGALLLSLAEGADRLGHRRSCLFAISAGVIGAGEPEPGPPVLGGGLGLGLILHEFPVSGLADDPAAGGAGQIVDGQPALGAEDAGELLRPGSEDEFDDERPRADDGQNEQGDAHDARDGVGFAHQDPRPLPHED